MTQSERISMISLLILLSMCSVRLNILVRVHINPSAHLYLTYTPSSTNKAFVFAAVLEYALANFLSRQHKGMIEVSWPPSSGFRGPVVHLVTWLNFFSVDKEATKRLENVRSRSWRTIWLHWWSKVSVCLNIIKLNSPNRIYMPSSRPRCHLSPIHIFATGGGGAVWAYIF